MKTNIRMLMIAAMFLICGLFPATGLSAQFRVLVVMSYGESFPWVIHLREGIDSVLADTCEIRYFQHQRECGRRAGKGEGGLQTISGVPATRRDCRG